MTTTRDILAFASTQPSGRGRHIDDTRKLNTRAQSHTFTPRHRAS